MRRRNFLQKFAALGAWRGLARGFVKARGGIGPLRALGSQSSEAALRPVGLQCEYSVNPLGIDVSKPRLSWRLESS